MTVPRRRVLFATVSALLCVAYLVPAAAQNRDDATLQYRANWFKCISAMQVLALRKNFNPRNPSPASVVDLNKAADRLETAVSALMAAMPPADSVPEHVTMIPRFQEVVAASRDMLSAAKEHDPNATEAAMLWLDEALNEADRTLIKATQRKI